MRHLRFYTGSVDGFAGPDVVSAALMPACLLRGRRAHKLADEASHLLRNNVLREIGRDRLPKPLAAGRGLSLALVSCPAPCDPGGFLFNVYAGIWLPEPTPYRGQLEVGFVERFSTVRCLALPEGLAECSASVRAYFAGTGEKVASAR